MKGIGIYFVIINVVTFIAYGIDKRKAVKSKWRIPEQTLILFATVGGSLGALLGMGVFHHKTRKPKFYIGVPCILVLQLLVIVAIVVNVL